MPLPLPKIRFVASTLVIGVLYFLTARLGLLLASINHNASPFWPATGVAILCLYFLGSRHVFAIALGAFAANHLAGSPLNVNAIIAFGNSLEALCGAEILRRSLRRDYRLIFQSESLLAIAVATLPTAISATIGNLALAQAGIIPWNGFSASWITWWVGDSLGALSFVSFALFIPKPWPTMSTIRNHLLKAWRWAYLGCSAALTTLVFVELGPGPWIFALLPLLLGAAVYFDALTTSGLVLIISGVGITATVLGWGPFSGGSLNTNLIHLQLFLAAIALAGIMIPGLLGSSQHRLLPLLCLLLSWIVAGCIFQSFQLDEKSKDKKHFSTLVEKFERDIDSRLDAYEHALRAGASLYAASDAVSRREWQKFLENLQVGRKYPGIKGIGVAFPVAPQDVAAFEAQQRKDYPDFKMNIPPDKMQDDHFLVTYLEPMATNAAAIGLDLHAEPRRRMAAELARDTGEIAATRPIVLVQDDQKRPGFLLFLPFYRQSLASNATLEERQRAFVCWIYAAFIAEEFFFSIFHNEVPELEVEIIALPREGSQEKLFSSLRRSEANHEPDLKTALNFAQQTLEINWYRGPGFQSSHDTVGAWAAFCTVLLGLLFTVVVVSLRDSGLRASTLAEERIHEIKRLEKSNRTNTKLVREIKDYGIVLLSPEGHITTWNDGAKALTGYEDHEIIGKHARVLYPSLNPEDQDSAEAMLDRVLKLGHAETEGWRIRKDGTRFMANVIYTRFDDEEGTLKGFSKVFCDVTRDREREHHQLTSLASLRLASAASKMGFFYIDTKASKLETSNELREVLGLDLNGDRDHDRQLVANAMDPEYQARFTELLGQFYSGKIAEMDFEHPLNSPRHGRIWLRQFMHASVKDAAGLPTFVVAFMQNISAQKSASERLQQSERRLTYALKGSNDGIWDWDLMTGEYYVSENLAERFGTSVVAISKPEDLAILIHPDELAPVVASIQAHWQGEAPLHECEARFKLQDGTYCWFLTRGKVSERLKDGRPLRMTGISIDITALKRAEASARSAREALEISQEKIIRQNAELMAATTAKSQFLATMSHEIRTPLNGVLGMADLLAETKLNADQLGLVRIVQQSGTTLLAIINDILDFSKIDAGKLQIEKVALNLTAIVEAQIELLFPQARQKGLMLSSFIAPEAAVKRVGDAGRVSQILLNLIGNAIKFTSAGSVHVEVQALAGAGIRFEIRDTGIGLSAQQIAGLFQPFKQADSSTSRKYGGTGLGLSICKGLALAMGGTIGVESESGKGSSFWFELPLPYAEQESVPRSFSPHFNIDQGPVAILVRDASTADLASRYIESWGMQVHRYPSLKDMQEGARPLLIVADAESAPHLQESSHPSSPALIVLPDLHTANLAQSSFFNAIVSALGPKDSGIKDEPEPVVVPDRHSTRILVAEDNAINQILVRRLLENLGFACHLVTNGLEVLQALENAPYDLILMDCQMPELDGYETTRRIRQKNDAQSRIPIIAVTANALSGDDKACLAAGMDDYLTKPLKKAQLEDKLKIWIGKVRVEQNANKAS